MSFLPSRGVRRAPIICFVALLFLFALYQLGIICGSSKEPTSVMVTKEVKKKKNRLITFFTYSLDFHDFFIV